MRQERGSWNVTTSLSSLNSFTAGLELAELVDQGHEIVVLTADLATSNRLTDFAERHPARFLNVGIAEQNMFSIAAGLATCGFIPYVATFASFAALLCAEHIRTDLAYTRLPVHILAHHAGISLGFYGTSHHAIEDIAITRSIPNLRVTAPCDGNATRAVIRKTVLSDGPTYIRLGRGRESDVYPEPPDLEAGRFVELRNGDELAVIAVGIGVHAAVAAADRLLSEDGVRVAVYDAIYLKPLDRDTILSAARRTGLLLTVEEHNLEGGLGAAVAATLGAAGCTARLDCLGIPDEFAPIAPPTHLYRHYGLTADGVYDRIKQMLAT